MKEMPQDYSAYRKNYSERRFWSKLTKIPRRLGYKIVYLALLLYYTLVSPDTSFKDKAIIYGALGYFILPTDLMPDFIPVLGYADDLTALVAAVRTVSHNITQSVREQATRRLERWFNRID